MYGLWMYVFCSVVIRASLGVRSSSGDILPSYEGIYNETLGPLTARVMDSKIIETRLLDDTPDSQVDLVENRGLKLPSIPFFSSSPDVCAEVLGCFSMSSPWSSLLRPIKAPMSPEDINASVDFFSPEHSTDPITISLYPTLNLEEIPFCPQRNTVVIVHGFASASDAYWVRDMATAYLNLKEVNLFALNWSGGAQKINYLEVVSNTRVVGRELALLIEKLITDYGVAPENFHLIGHSLGAHICSYAAKEIQGIGRLTALDPAQPAFEGFSAEVRLASSDADFVEVLHTDAKPFVPTLGFGMMAPYGHVDFYFNGGFDQPGCLIPKIQIPVFNLASLGKFPVEVLSSYVSCPHSRAYNYFIEALNSSTCIFWGRKIRIPVTLEIVMNFLTQGLIKLPSYETCSAENCIPVGLNSIDSPLRGSFVVVTSNSPPFCKG